LSNVPIVWCDFSRSKNPGNRALRWRRAWPLLLVLLLLTLAQGAAVAQTNDGDAPSRIYLPSIFGGGQATTDQQADSEVEASVHDDGLSQLDYVTSPAAQGAANVPSANISPPGNTGDDWDKVYAGTDSAFAATFIDDPTGSAETSFFTGGGSKDERDINGGAQHWEWDDTNDVIPDKDDIDHAFAAAYQPTSG
jgi:hypothetical protein